MRSSQPSDCPVRSDVARREVHPRRVVHARRAVDARRAVLAAIILLAAGLRLTRLGLIEFKYDEATTVRTAMAIAREGRLPAVGMISSEGPRNPPLVAYVLAPPFLVSDDPRLAAAWLALLGVAAVALTYWMGNAFFRWPVGAVAAALFAASPWAVFQSRKLWTQNLPLFTLLFISSLLVLTVRRRSWALVPAFAALGALISLHLGGLAFLVVLAAVLVLFRHRVRPRPLLVGFALLLLILSPYLVHDAMHGWANLRAFGHLGSSGPSFNLRALTMAVRVVGGSHLEDLAGAQQDRFLSSILDLRWLDQLEILLCWLGLVWSAWRVGREAVTHRGSLSPDGQARAVLLCWFLIPVALLTQRPSIQPHDLNLLYPVQHLFLGLLLADAAAWIAPFFPRPGITVISGPAALISLLVVPLVAWQVYYQQALLTFVDRHDTPGGHGAPIKHTLEAAHRLETLDASGGGEMVVLLPGGDPRYHGPAAVFDALLNHDRRLVDGRAALVLPTRPSAYLVHPEAATAASLLSELAVESKPPLPLREGRDAAYRFYRWEPGPVTPDEACADPPQWAVPVPSDAGVRVTLLGYQWSGDPEPGGHIEWTIVWRVSGGPPPEASFHWFNHLVDRDGMRWGQKDGVGLPTAKWRDGDTVLTWFSIPIPPDAPPPPYYVRTGLYAYPDVVNLPLVSAPGEPPAQFAELGPIEASP